MKILVLGDTHFPFIDLKCLQAVHKFAQKYKPDRVVQVGDLIDGKAWSVHPKDTDDPSPHEEWEMVTEGLAYLNRLFPEIDILYGNHDRRIALRATENRLPKQLIKTMSELFPYEGWRFHAGPRPFELDGTVFIHGDESAGNAGQQAARAGKRLVRGHDHMGYIQFVETYFADIWGMSAGAMIDRESIAARYAARNFNRTFLGVATVTHGRPALHQFLHGEIA